MTATSSSAPRPGSVRGEESARIVFLSSLDHIRSYYESLNTGDVDLVASHFTDDATHYYTRLGPHEGARATAENEWTMTWRDPKSGERRLNRGTEWFRMRDGKIAEVRAYHHGDAKNPRGDLLGFDFHGRGYTTLDDWRAPGNSGAA